MTIQQLCVVMDTPGGLGLIQKTMISLDQLQHEFNFIRSFSCSNLCIFIYLFNVQFISSWTNKIDLPVKQWGLGLGIQDPLFILFS